jgi:hypothetical protein
MNNKNTKRPVGRPRKKTLTIDLAKYGNDVCLAIAHAKQEAEIELNEFEVDLLNAELEVKKNVKYYINKVKTSIKKVNTKFSNWINK